MTARRRKVLVLCTANSARSQMAEGVLRSLAGDRLEVASAGATPATVHPLAVAAMAEIGIDISNQRSKSLAEFRDVAVDEVITVCDRAAATCPSFPGPARRTHLGVADPAAVDGDEAVRLAAFRSVRDELASRLRTWYRGV